MLLGSVFTPEVEMVLVYPMPLFGGAIGWFLKELFWVFLMYPMFCGWAVLESIIKTSKS